MLRYAAAGKREEVGGMKSVSLADLLRSETRLGWSYIQVLNKIRLTS